MSIVMDTTFSNWLIEEMRERDWSQSDLARASGLTRQAISYYLSDKSKAPDREAEKKLPKTFETIATVAAKITGVFMGNFMKEFHS